jgi:hypothetical protein
MMKITVEYSTPALVGDGLFWKVNHGFESSDGQWQSYRGYLHEDDLEDE